MEKILKITFWVICYLFSVQVNGSQVTDKTVSILLDLRRESECNNVKTEVDFEDTEAGRQRAEAALWTIQRLKKIKPLTNGQSIGRNFINIVQLSLDLRDICTMFKKRGRYRGH